MEWIATTVEAAGLATLTALGLYLWMVVLTRLAGLRSFSKMSAFDFAVTVAIGSLLATSILNPDPPLLLAAVALGVLYAIQFWVGAGRHRWKWLERLVDNEPLLLMRDGEIVEGSLREARMTVGDLRGKLREANVLDLTSVRAVVMENTGDVSVLHGEPDREIDPWLLEGVRRANGSPSVPGDVDPGPRG